MSEPETVLSLWKGPVAAKAPYGSMAVPGSVMLAACDEAARAHGVSPREILSGHRNPRVTLARHGMMWRLRSIMLGGAPKYSYPAIGSALGMDHTSCIHGCRRYERWLAEREA